jgi:(p)ppGpp synthase/HD superfamily hydrolase
MSQRLAMHTYAQTNIQLFNQMGREGYAAADLTSVRVCYEFMTVLMTGRFRASGKTFIAHLVGTASILASLRAPGSLLAAALLHAVYQAGDFGDDRPGITDAKRQRLRGIAGEQVEEYVYRYHGLSWTDQTIRSLVVALDGMPGVEREVVLIRMANELEEFLDLGILYCCDGKRLHATGTDRCRHMVQVANKLGFPRLAAEMAQAFAEAATTTLSPELKKTDARDSSYLLAPQSYQRLKDALARRVASGQEKLPESTP